MSKKIIWVVDDDAIYQVIINKIIKRSEMFSASSSFKNGKEAVSALHKIIENTELIPDIILLDINMPVMDGFEAASQLRPQFPDATLLILTANVQASSRNQAEALGVHFLAKPISAVIARQALALWGSEHA